MKLRRFISILLAILLLASCAPAFAGSEVPYYITVDLTNQIVTIYSTQTNEIVRQMLCSSGLEDSTPTGNFTMPKSKYDNERKEWYYFNVHHVYAHYASRIYINVLFHSLTYNRRSEASISKAAVAQFGQPASHGCIRLRTEDAKFIAENCLPGTKVSIYKSEEPDEDLRQLLYQSSFVAGLGMSYQQFLGIPDEEGVLGRYSMGPEVRDLQYRLHDLGFFNGELSGEFKADTVTAVRQAQKEMGMEETGIATQEFQNALYSNDAPTAMNVTMREGSSGPAVRNLQQELTDLELYDGSMDSVYDIDVAEAVKLFQEAYGYDADGVATPEVQKAIYYEHGKVQAMFAEDGGYTLEIKKDATAMARVDSSVGIRIREKASKESDTKGRLVDGDELLVLEKGKEWTHIQYGEKIGYVKNIFLQYYEQYVSRLSYSAVNGDRVYTIGHTLAEYEAGATRPADGFSEYLAANGSLDNYDGMTTVATVMTEGSVVLNLRQAPNTSAEVLAELPSGAQAEVVLQSPEWTLVNYQGQQGYLLNDYLEFNSVVDDGDSDGYDEPLAEEIDSDTLQAVVNSAEKGKAPVYAEDSEDAEVLGHLDDGVYVEVVESVDGWSHIVYQGHEGYMYDRDLRFVNEGPEEL